jgi:hypothetical protein
MNHVVNQNVHGIQRISGVAHRRSPGMDMGARQEKKRNRDGDAQHHFS